MEIEDSSLSPFLKSPTFRETSIAILKFGLPLIITGFSNYGLYFLNAYIVSLRQDATMLGSMGIGDTLYQVIGEGMAYGFSLAFYVQFVPLIAQKQYAEGCRLFYRRIAAAFFAALPIIVLFLFSHRLFIFVGVLPELANGAYEFLISLIPTAYLVFVSYTFLNFLSAYNQQNIYIFIQLLGGIVELVSVYVAMVIHKGELYWVGLLLGLFFVNRIGASVIYCKYVLVKEFPGSWVWPTWDMFSGMGEEVKYGWDNALVSLPITLLIEINIVISGGLTDVEAAVQSLVFRLYAPIVYLMDDLSFSVISKVLFYKGEGDRKLSKLYLDNGLKLIILACGCLAIFWYTLGDPILSRLIPESEEFEGPMRSALKYVGIANFLHGFVIHFAKLLRSHDKAPLCAVTLILGCLLVQIPVGYLLCFYYDLRLEGIWIAFILALLFDLVMTVYFASKIDHRKMLNSSHDETNYDVELFNARRLSTDQ